MFDMIKGNLSLKLLFMLILVLAVSFAGLSLTILNRQHALLSQMSDSIATALKQTENQNLKAFETLASKVDTRLEQMGTDTSANLSQATRSALENEESQIRVGMESLLQQSLKGLTGMLNSVAPATIMKKDFRELVKYSKAAAETEQIIYTLFFDKDGQALPGFLNARDPRIKTYVKTGTGDTNIEKVIAASRADDGVIVFEQTIEFYGTVQGKILICISRDAVVQEIDALKQRFAALIDANETRIAMGLADGSSEVNAQIKQELAGISQSNTKVFEQTADILNSSARDVTASIRTVTITVGIFCSVAILVLTGIALKLMVVTPIRRISDGLRDTAEGEGDLTRRLSDTRTDELGALAGWFDKFLERLNAIILDIRANAGTVTGASEDVLKTASDMSRDAGELSDRANAVAAAAEEMSANMDSVAAASEQASINMNTVANATDQMKTTLNSVAENCSRARTVADEAAKNVTTASNRVNRLGDAAREISKVTEVITEIAEQTNLLALNATIEAARAGAAGKGFAVVAEEIKSLAFQTADATQEIREKVSGIQNSTQDTVEDVDRITRVISDVNDIVLSISGAVEEQSAIAVEVADNVSQASAGIGEVSENVAQSSLVSSEISKDISEVNTVTQSMSQKGVQMEERARELSGLAATLKEMIGVFKVSEK